MSESKKVVLITGAAGGIGRATVQYFAGHGWRVIGVDRHPFGEELPSEWSIHPGGYRQPRRF